MEPVEEIVVEKSRGGRPRGGGGPEEILRREMRETASLCSRVRSCMERAIGAIEKRMSEANTPDTLISLAAPLPGILAALTRNVEACGKLLMPRATSPPDPEEEDMSMEDVIAEMEGKKRGTR